MINKVDDCCMLNKKIMFIFQFINKNKSNIVLMNIKIYMIKYFKTDFIISNNIIHK